MGASLKKALVAAATVGAMGAADAQGVDFRYAPAWWQTAICMPDDPDKVLVGKEGQLLLDFGVPTGVRSFSTVVQPDVAEGSQWLSQQTLTARVPIMQTHKVSDGIQILEETFLVPPDPAHAPAEPRLTRTDGDSRLNLWANPSTPCIGAFTGVDVAPTLRYQFRVSPGAHATIVFGLCEGWHKEPGKRPLVLSAEGSTDQVADPVKDFGHNIPGIYQVSAQDLHKDGVIQITVSPPKGDTDHNAILNALWAFDGDLPSGQDLLHGGGHPAGFWAGPTLPPRRSLICVRLSNNSAVVQTRTPVLHVFTPSVSMVRSVGAEVIVNGNTRISSRSPLKLSTRTDKTSLELPTITLKPGESRSVVFTVDHNPTEQAAPATVEEAKKLRTQAIRVWNRAPLPYDAIQVPDPDIQGMVDSSIRNIWQAREIKNGKPAFHVGPTMYRGLWIVDGAFLLESAAMLGRGHDARAGMEYLLSFQKDDGSFEVISQYWKENGIVLWATTRHAMLTHDQAWLRSIWPNLRRVVGAIRALRDKASQDPKALNYRLIPAGFTDGGISDHVPEYSNIYWNLAGLKAAIHAAQWLGEKEDATAWQKEYDDFYGAFKVAAQRDTLKDKFGHEYLPNNMANFGQHSPQKSQWAFFHAVYPGQVFAPDDPLALSQMEMFRSVKKEGLIQDTGYMEQGLWTYAGAFYAQAALWQGKGQESAEILYDYARHSSPTRVWREEQMPVGEGTQEVGDMPHNWASAEFIRLVVHLIALERGDELHLFEGVPASWLKPGMQIRLKGVATQFGDLDLSLKVGAKSATLTLKGADLARKVVVHGTGTPVVLAGGKPIRCNLNLAYGTER